MSLSRLDVQSSRASGRPLKVGVLTTHPIQYQVPWFRKLGRAEAIDLHVFFAMLPEERQQGEGFGVGFAWDVPLMDGYRFSVLKNVAAEPSVTRFSGCDTPQIESVVREGDWDAFIVNGWVAKSCLQLLLACRRHGIPCLVRGEANGLTPRPAWKRLGHRLLLTQYAAFLAIGKNNRSYYLQSGVNLDRIFDTPYCVDNDSFAASAARAVDECGRDAVRAKFGLDADKFVFAFSGKFVEKKRPGDFIEAIRIAAGECDQIQALVVGSGPLARELSAQASGLPIRFTGFLNQSQMPTAYAAADVLVLPSDYGETWGLVVNEAMACGLPAVVSDSVGCAADLILPSVTGFTYPCGDVTRLAQVMVQYATDRDLASAHGRAAREHVGSNYNYDNVVAGMRTALEKTVADARVSR